MIERHLSQFALLGGLLTLLSGCGTGQDNPPLASSLQDGRSSWCEAACSYSARCTGPVATYCVSSCLSTNAGYFSGVNNDYLNKVAPCIKGAACASDWKTMSNACYQSTAPTVVASASVIDFCKAMSSEFFDCFFADDDLTFCVSDFAAWSDAAVQRAKACSTAACTNLNTCLSNAFSGTN